MVMAAAGTEAVAIATAAALAVGIVAAGGRVPVVPHKAVAVVSKKEGLVVVTHGWQSESTDGPKGGWSCFFLEWLLDVVWCCAVVVVAVVLWSCSCKL